MLGSGRLFQGVERFNRFEDFFNVAGYFQAAPLVRQNTFFVDEKGAALNAFDLFAVHDFVFHDAKHMAHFFFGVSDQLKG